MPRARMPRHAVHCYKSELNGFITPQAPHDVSINCGWASDLSQVMECSGPATSLLNVQATSRLAAHRP
jgi:hypothetical protein